MNECTIVTYHYIRDLSRSRYPDINALTVDEFQYQLNYIESEYSIITVDDLRSAVIDGENLPENPALLTFDDGFADHYETVFPILKQQGIQGAFFPPVNPIINDTVLDVHKIHTILAQRDTDEQLLNDVFELVQRYQQQFDLKSANEYFVELAEEGRWDPVEIVFIKRLLQYALPEEARRGILDDLFKQYLDVNEKTLSQEWYLTKAQLQVMVEEGMYVGGHTANHYWLNRLSRQKTVHEIEASLSFLADINIPTEKWVMSYPYGAYNEIVIDVLREHGCALGFTKGPRIANIKRDNPLKLPRLDTNDLPQTEADH